jgi:hypothetical protein
VAKFPDSPSLSSIEKKIKNYEYKTVNDFCDDLRKLWNYQFKHYAKEPNIYQNICKMSLLSDQICKELSNDNLNENKNEEISNIKKRNEKVKKSINEIKENNQSEELNRNSRKQNMEEINHLGQLIRTLNKQQLKGIIPILSDKNETSNTKMFEFDLEQLSFEKFKKLEEYVLNCKNKNKNPTKIINKNIGTNREINRNIRNNNEQEQKDKQIINNTNHYINNTNNNSKNLNQREKNLNEPFKNHEKKNNINNDYIPNQTNKVKAKENKNEEFPKKDIEKIDEIKGNNLNEKNNKNNKPKSWEEINHLGQLIRTLNRQQLKGIIPILSDKNDNNNEKMFEFNLEQLSLEKFEKLEEYVLNCKNKNSNNNNNKNINIANKEINKNENKINKNVNNNLNINNKNNNNNVNSNEINKNLNIKEKNMNIQKANNLEENPKKSFSDSDSMSSYSSLSN